MTSAWCESGHVTTASTPGGGGGAVGDAAAAVLSADGRVTFQPDGDLLLQVAAL